MNFFKYLFESRLVTLVKNTQFVAKPLTILLGLFVFSFYGYNQTITDAQPRRVTTGSVVTVTGTGFTPGLENTLTFNISGFNITGPGNRTFVNETTMTFTIEQDDSVNRTGQLQCSGCTVNTTSISMDYIGPVLKNHNITGGNQINPRVEEIYTDFSSSALTYRDGDAFDTGVDYDPTNFGKWEFFGLEFDTNPEGVLVEAGGSGRGMFIGFDDDGNFIARGGDGAAGTPDGGARLEIYREHPNPLYDYDFAEKSGRLVVTMNPSNGVLTLDFDENNTGLFDYTASITAVNNGFTNGQWAGGNSGFVGTSLGNVAGSSITTNYDFNGVIEGMIFTNTEDDGKIAWRSDYGTYSGQPSGEVPNEPILPDNYHDLLGFKFNNQIYSTGANDGLLELFLGVEVDNDGGPGPGPEYTPASFRAYSTNGVQNRVAPQHHIFVGDLLDGKPDEGVDEFLTSTDTLYSFEKIRGLSMFDVLYDGQNGLNLGSGINNLNQTTTIQFFSGNAQFGFTNDGIPDLLIPNMAQAGGTDVYYFSDEQGNVIGTPLAIAISDSNTENPPLSDWLNDQYSLTEDESFELAKPTLRLYNPETKRPMRLIALELDDFGINDGNDPFTSVGSIFNINVGAGGTADLPFLAYNGDTFEIKSPVVTERPVPRSVCEADGSTDVVFSVTATVDGGFTGLGGEPGEGEAIDYIWYKFNNEITDGSKYEGTTTNTLTVKSVDSNDLGLYRLKISNTFGTTIVTVTIEEGGIRVTWNGSQWVYPQGFTSESEMAVGADVILDSDRKMVIAGDYPIGSNEVLEGCSCVVFPGNEISVASNGVLKLFDELILRPSDIIDNPIDGSELIRPSGKLTMENNASLVQMKPVTFNQNTGEILMKRIADNLQNSDYIYWSSPVDEFEIGNINGDNSFKWDTAFPNTNGTHGNWVTMADSHEMEIGIGYIKRVPNGNPQIQTDFFGRPRNGTITVPLMQTPDELPLPLETADINRNWNLIGNPYPSAISAVKFLLENADGSNATIEGAVHLWTHGTQIGAFADPFYQDFGGNYNSNDYITYNLVGASVQNGFEGNIASGQGFFVKALNTADPDAIFTNLMRFNDSSNSDDTDPILNDQFYRVAGFTNEGVVVSENQKIWLSLVNASNLSSSILIGYINGATFEKDNLFDAKTNGGAFSIYSMINDDKMVIQGRPVPFDDTDIVPLGVTLNESGIFNIAINQVEGNLFLDEEQNIFLEDTYLNLIHDLRQSPYSFTAELGEINDRFLLRYTDETLSTMDNQLSTTFAFINNDVLKVKSNKQINTVEIFDLTGKHIVRHYAAGNLELEEDFNHTNGIYLARILFSDGSILNKKIIN